MIARPRFTIPLPYGRTLELGERTLVMGILNVTPDSFSDGGALAIAEEAVRSGLRMASEGADILDVGGESTRPGAAPVRAGTEISRVVPVIEALARETTVPISVDTTKAAVARAALEAGAAIVNDISGLMFEPQLGEVVARFDAAVVLMHTRGRPDDMQRRAEYVSVVDEVASELQESVRRALAAGVRPDGILLDPGLGFAKHPGHSLEILARLDAAPLAALQRPWVVGPSRKSFLTSAIGERSPAQRDWATAGAVAAAVMLGAHVVRTHRVAEMVDVVRVTDAVLGHRARRR